MTLIRPSLDYTAKDFDALAARLFNLIPTAFPGWTDTQIANFGNLLVEMFAYVGDVLTYYQDNQAHESRWSTALLRSSLLSMAKLIGYRAKGASAATATLTFQLTKPAAGSVTIQAGDVFLTEDANAPVKFRAVQSTTIAAGTSPAVAFIVVENSEPASEMFTSTGLASQKYMLEAKPYVDESLQVTADDGTYTIVDDFLMSSSSDRHVVITVDETSRVQIVFGNGINGCIPIGTIYCTYKIGGGAGGNVDRNKIRRAAKSYVDASGNPVVVRVTNVVKATGGADLQTVESIRELAPVSLRALTRTVAREDYEIHALKVPGVCRALMLSRDEQPTILENRGILYIVPEGGGAATAALVQAVSDKIIIEFPKTITFKLTVRSAKYLLVNVSTRIHLARGVSAAAVSAAVREAVSDFFALRADDGSRNNNIDFGYYLDGALAWSDVFNAVRDTAGVRKVDDGLGNLALNGQADDLEVPPDTFPLLGTVTVINAATGLVI